MKKGLLAIVFALLASMSAYAGVFSGDNESFTCDFRIGCNFNTIYAHLHNPEKRGKIGSYKGGFSGGLNFRFYPSEIFAIETGLGIQQKGSKDMTIEGWNNGVQYNPWYLEMPLLGSIRVIEFSNEHTGFIDAGVYGAYGLGGKWTSYFDEGPMFGNDGLLKRGDFGFLIGGSAIFAENFYAGFRYQQSFINLGNGEVGSFGKFYNNGFTIRIGLIF